MESVNHHLTLIRESLNPLDWSSIDQNVCSVQCALLTFWKIKRIEPIRSDLIRSDPIATKHQRNAQCASLNLYYFVQYCICGTRKMHSFIIIIITHITVQFSAHLSFSVQRSVSHTVTSTFRSDTKIVWIIGFCMYTDYIIPCVLDVIICDNTRIRRESERINIIAGEILLMLMATQSNAM